MAYTPDILVVVITWYRTARIAYSARGVNLGRPSIVPLLLRDGTTFFLADLMIDTVIVYYELTQQVALSEVAITMWSILMSRFILNLRRTADQSTEAMTATSIGTSGVTTLQFASTYFDNLGAPLDLDDDCDHPLDEGIRMTERRPFRG